jgi:chorismate mutase
MKIFPIYISKQERKLVDKIKRLTLKKMSNRPVEEISRSLDVVDHIIREANDFGLTTEVVTWALKSMKENPKQDISDAIIAGYDEWLK